MSTHAHQFPHLKISFLLFQIQILQSNFSTGILRAKYQVQPSLNFFTRFFLLFKIRGMKLTPGPGLDPDFRGFSHAWLDSDSRGFSQARIMEPTAIVMRPHLGSSAGCIWTVWSCVQETAWIWVWVAVWSCVWSTVWVQD